MILFIFRLIALVAFNYFIFLGSSYIDTYQFIEDIKLLLNTEISVQMTVEHTNEIQINDKTKLVLTYPKLGDMKNIPDGTDDYGRMFLMLNKCIQEIHFDDKGHLAHNGDTGLQIIAPISINA